MPPTPPSPDPELLLELVSTRMPFGKYKGELLLDLPEAYLAWLSREGFPKGRLGVLLENAFTVKTNGLVPMLRKLMPPGERMS